MTDQRYARIVGTLVLTTVFFAGAPATLPAAQTQNPIQAFKNAWKQAKQQAEEQKRQQQQQLESQPAANPQSPTSASGASPASPSQNGPIVPAAAWVPPTGASDSASRDSGAGTPEVPVNLNPAKLPDVLGLRLGMPAAEATVAVHKAYPVNIIEHFPFTSWPDRSNPNMGFTVLDTHNQSDVDMNLSFTAPPGPQLLWRVYRSIRALNINHQVFLNDLRAKYGRETFATDSRNVVKDDAQISTLVWLYKEDGERIPPSALTPFQVQSAVTCWGAHDVSPQSCLTRKTSRRNTPAFAAESWCSRLGLDRTPSRMAQRSKWRIFP